MEENLAWQEFEKTGKIDSYLKYIEIKNRYKEETGIIKGDGSEVIQSKGNSN